MSHSRQLAANALLRTVLLIWLPLIGVLASGMWLLYADKASQFTERKAIQSRNAIDEYRDAMRYRMENTLRDLQYLAKLLSRTQDDGSPHERTLQQLQQSLFDFMQVHSASYDQLRYLNEAGVEVVRVNNNNGNPQLVPASQLQDKHLRYYVSQGLKLGPDDIYISHFDLNIEHGAIELPHKPMLRFVRRVYDKHGTPNGLVVINYFGRTILDELQSDDSQLWLLNSDGYWLRGPAAGDEWGFMYAEQQPVTLARRHPQLWQHLTSGEPSGQLLSEGGLFVFATFSPDTEYATTDEQLISADRRWYFIDYTPATVLSSQLLPLRQEFLGYFALNALLVTLLSLIVARLWGRKQRAEQLLQSHLHNLEETVRQRTETVHVLEARSRALLDSAGEGIVGLDLNGNTIFANPAACEMLRYSLQELLGQPFLSLVRAPDELQPPAPHSPAWHGVLAGKVKRCVDERLRRKDGSCFAAAYTKTPLTKQGEVTGVVVTFSDITARKALEDELRLAKQASDAAALAKSEFLANMSHEIRTPMNAILGLTELAMRTELTPQQQVYLEQTRTATVSLLGIINDILDLSRVESGKLALENTEFHLASVIDNLTAVIGMRAMAKGLQFSITIAEAVPTTLLGDPLRLGQILINLCNNALKFTDAGGNVALLIEVARQDDACTVLHFSVRDTGIGISAEQQEHLFSAFSQGDSSTARRYGGSGLGLAISKTLTEMMGGAIWLESTPGVGSTFHFTAPLKRSAVSTLHAAPAGAEEAHADAASTINLRGAKILLVEDNEINRKVALEFLTAEGMAVEVAADGLEALQRVEREQFDAVLMDCQMPVMDGYTASRKIREQPRFRKLPIIALTANVMPGERDKVLAAGMNDYLAKPLDVPRMLATLAKWITPAQTAAVKLQVVHASTSLESSQLAFPALPGIDVEAGLSANMNNCAVYHSILVMFRDKYGDFAQQFALAQRSAEKGEASRLAHSLTAVAAVVAARELQQAAAALDHACRYQAEQVPEKLQQVVAALQPVLAGVATIDGATPGDK